MLTKKEKKKDYDKAHYAANREKYKAQVKDYYAAHKEEIKAYKKEYKQTPAGKKSSRMSNWKVLGIRSDNWDITYERYINSVECEFCGKEYSNSKDRCLDHNHSITDSYNIRGVLCMQCNIKDVLG